MSGIALEGVAKWYGGLEVLPPVTIGIAAGEAIGLWGPTGCGKTTLLRMIAGITQPDAGTIRIGSRLVNDPAPVVPPGERRIGMVFQDLALWPHMTARRHLEYALRASCKSRKERRDLSEALLSRVHLADCAAKYPGAMSRGQRQRLAVARALCNDPDVLLFDEPVSSQDPAMVESMTGLFRDQKAGGKTLIIAAHDKTSIAAIADRVLLFESGRIRCADAADAF